MRIVFWLAGIFTFLFASIWLVLKVPAVQNFLVSKATGYVSNKTHTKVQLNNINIGFPKSILLEGIFLEDVQHDTLLSLTRLEIDLNMLALLHNTVDVQTLSLENGYVRLKRNATDSTFNFQFLIDAFSSPDETKPAADTSAGSPWDIKARSIVLKATRFEMLDDFSGMDIHAAAGFIKAELDELNLAGSSVELGDIEIEDVHGKILATKASVPDTDTSAQGWDGVAVSNLSILRSSFLYSDNISKMSVDANIGELKLKKTSLSLIQQRITSEGLLLHQSASVIRLEKETMTVNNTEDVEKVASEQGWNVQLANLDLEGNRFDMGFTNVKAITKGIDWNHLSLRSIQAKIEDIVYNGPVIQATIESLSAQEKSGFGIRSLKAKASMDARQAELSGLNLNTNYSHIGQHIHVTYNSIEDIASSLRLNCSLNNNLISLKDVLFFAPDLDTVEIIHKNIDHPFRLNLNASGSLEDLKVRAFNLQTLNTQVRTNGNLKHLTDPDKLFMELPSVLVQTGQSDLAQILPDSMLPASIRIPDTVSIKGNYKGSLSDFISVLEMNSSIGNATIDATMKGLLSEAPSYDVSLNTNGFNLGKLLNQSSLGSVNGHVHAKGTGFDTATAKATVKAEIKSIGINQYNYRNISLEASIDTSLISAKGDVADSNLIVSFDGKINLAKEHEFYDLKADLRGIDFYGLKLSKEHVSLSANANVHFTGNSSSTLNGHADVRNILVIQNGKRYKADSLVFISVNDPGKSKASLNSSMVAASFEGNIDPLQVVPAISNHFNRYFKFNDEPFKATKAQNFAFELQLNDSPLLREVILASLTDYYPMHVAGSFNSEEAKLTLDADVPYVVYDGLMVKDFFCTIDSDKDKLSYNTGWGDVMTSGLNIQETTVGGTVAHDTASISLQIKNEKEEEKLLLKTNLTKASVEKYRFTILPDGLALQGKKWNVSDKNYIEFAKNYLFANHLILSQEKQSISLQSSENGADLTLKFTSFNLHTFSQIAEQDTLLVQGILNGDILLKNYHENPAFTSELNVQGFSFKQSRIGNLNISADNLTANRYTAKVVLTDSLNNATVSGYYSTNAESSALNFNADIQSIQLSSLEAFTQGQISESSGIIKGDVKITGATKNPKFNGSIQFVNASTHVAYINQHLYMNKETISLSPDKVDFHSFNIKDSLNNEAIINGYIGISSYDDIKLHLNATTDKFVILNTTAKNNKLYYGKVILNSKISVRGTTDLPVVNADLDIGSGSHFTFAIPDSKVSVDRGDGVVIFRSDSSSLDPIMLRQDLTPPVQKFTGIDLSAKVSINKNSTLKILVDPVSGDSLSVRGNADLNFKLNPSGETTLTGRYTLSEGSYKASLENLIVRNFQIKRGSTIIWSGDPLDALIDIRATYSTKTTPDGLLVNSAISDSSALRKPLPFIVVMHMEGELMKPVISFQLDMPDNVKGAVGGEVYSKLTAINADESEVNKQVFALLVLNRFIAPDNSNGGTSDFARRSVSRMMSNELNKLSSKYVQGVEIDFDVQSYNDIQQQGNTQVQVGVTKNLLDERLSVQVGGNVNVEGQGANANSNTKNFTGDVVVEYKLTKNGRYRVKGFRTNQYDNISNGTIVETGAGLMYIRNFTLTKELFSSKKKK